MASAWFCLGLLLVSSSWGACRWRGGGGRNGCFVGGEGVYPHRGEGIRHSCYGSLRVKESAVSLLTWKGPSLSLSLSPREQVREKETHLPTASTRARTPSTSLSPAPPLPSPSSSPPLVLVGFLYHLRRHHRVGGSERAGHHGCVSERHLRLFRFSLM